MNDPPKCREFLLWLSVSKVTHNNVKSDDLIRLREQLHLVIRDEVEVVKVVELVDEHRIWVRVGIIVNKPSGHVPVQSIRNDIEKGLFVLAGLQRFSCYNLQCPCC